MALVRNEQNQPMGEIFRNEKKGFTALTVHEPGNGIDTLLESTGRFWLWLVDERVRSEIIRKRGPMVD